MNRNIKTKKRSAATYKKIRRKYRREERPDLLNSGYRDCIMHGNLRLKATLKATEPLLKAGLWE